MGVCIKKCNTVLKRAVAAHFIHAKIESHLTLFMTLGSEHWRGECFETRCRNCIMHLLYQLESEKKIWGGCIKKCNTVLKRAVAAHFIHAKIESYLTLFMTLVSDHRWGGECIDWRY